MELSLTEFFTLLWMGSIGVCFVLFATVMIISKRNRMRRAQSNITCRLCGYRFIRRDPVATCPHCQAHNR